MYIRVTEVRQIEIQLSCYYSIIVLSVEIAIAKLKKYKSPGSDQIPAEMCHAGGETLQIHKLVNSILNKAELPDQWKECIIFKPIHRRNYW
jgi:hypothetical protein